MSNFFKDVSLAPLVVFKINLVVCHQPFKNCNVKG